jgi:catechol 2,3-dioxygenase-like lactoylglutathione lyase family enzyme
MPALDLLVLRCEDVDATGRFYAGLGLTWVEEQHGSGPRHLAGTLGPTVVELYPATAARPPEAGLRLGLTVADLDAATAALDGAGHARRAGAEVSYLDPDGRIVVLAPEGP